MSLDLRIVDEGVYSEPTHHALDKALTEGLEVEESPPTLRIWYRERPSVPFGRFQAYSDEVAVEYAQENDIEVVRRITGGGAMYTEPGSVITYSLYLPRDAVPDDVEQSYAELDRWAIEALQGLGLAAAHEPLNDIVHPDGKLGGSAQLRTGDAVLHHTTMSYDLDLAEMLRVLRIGEQKISDKAVKSAEQRVARIADYVDHSRETVIEALIASARETYGGHEGTLTDAERSRARELVDEQFATDEWNRKIDVETS